MLTSHDIKALCIGEGAALVGVAPAGKFKKAGRGWLPAEKLPGCRSVIVVGCTLPPGVLSMDWNRYTDTREEISTRINRVALRLAERLREYGYGARAVGTGRPTRGELLWWDKMSMSRAGENAGLGLIIRNYMLTNPLYGSLIWLAAVLTDLELEPDRVMQKNFCGGCNLCVVACPSGAMNDPVRFNQKACDSVRCVNNGGRTEYRCYECVRACPLRYGNPANDRV